MKIAVIGSRTFDDQIQLNKELSEVFKDGDCLVSGGAKGADKLAEDWCRENDFECEIIYPDWQKHGQSAAFKRNHTIIEMADSVVAFWDGQSKGTKHSIDLAKQKGIDVKICLFEEGE